LTLTGSAGTSGQALVSAGSGNAPTWSTVSSDTVGFKNRIINGAMVIDQRNAGASVTLPAAVTYTLDRWYVYSSQASKLSCQQNAGSVTPPVGFTKYLGLTSLSAYSVGSGEVFWLNQPIEGLNATDLAWGTANAATITISFRVYSSLTGSFGGAIRNGAGNRSYPFSFTISSANTWTTISVTIAGDTSGTWATDNSSFCYVTFSLGAGSTFSGTANSWQAGNLAQPTGAVSIVGTNGATFYITGVQLEKGSTATSFDYRPYGTELALCQRYYYSSGTGNQTYTTMGNGWEYSSTAAQVYCPLPVPMRVAPTSVSYNALQLNDSLGSNPSVSSLTVSTVECSTIAGKVNIVITGGNAGAVCMLRASNSTSGYIAFNAEL
jgi:hypothetical protein